jgi:RimJ/RimL family protein N-acetyltransferase
MQLNRIQPYLNDIITGHTKLQLLIKNDLGEVLGLMCPLTIKHLKSEEIIQKLTDWRNQNSDCFLTTFTATPQRTKAWLANIVFKTHGQMLFLVYENEKLVGHVGFKNLSYDDGVLDNAIKGAKTEEAKLFVFAHKAIAQWLFEVAKITRLFGYVLTDNVSAIMMNRQIGFVDWTRYPLLKEEKNGEVQWSLGPMNELSPSKKYCFKIVLNKWV